MIEKPALALDAASEREAVFLLCVEFFEKKQRASPAR